MRGILATRVREQALRIPTLEPDFLDVHRAAVGARYGEKGSRIRTQAGREYDLRGDGGLDHVQTFAIEAGAQATFGAEGESLAAYNAQIFRIGGPGESYFVIPDYGFHPGLLRSMLGHFYLSAHFTLKAFAFQELPQPSLICVKAMSCGSAANTARHRESSRTE
jgi:hypothetical protein